MDRQTRSHYIKAMARPRTFDPDKVLDVALDFFWRSGYQHTSLDEIAVEVGLTKPSLYAAFGDKASLFVKVLDRYHAVLLARSTEVLSNGSSARDAIEAWFLSLLPLCSGPEARRGCLSVNTATSVDAPIDNVALEASLAQFNEKLEYLILSRLRRDRAQFSSDFDPAATTRMIMVIYNGLMVMAKQTPSPKHVKSVIRQIAKLLT